MIKPLVLLVGIPGGVASALYHSRPYVKIELPRPWRADRPDRPNYDEIFTTDDSDSEEEEEEEQQEEIEEDMNYDGERNVDENMAEDGEQWEFGYHGY